MSWDDHIAAATLAAENGAQADAEAQLKQALQLAKATFRHNDPRIPQTLSFLGQLYFRDNRLDDAEPLLQQAMSISGSMPNSDQLCRAMDLYALACIQKKRGNHKESQKFFEKALPLLERYAPEQAGQLAKAFEDGKAKPAAKTEKKQIKKSQEAPPAEPVTETKAAPAEVVSAPVDDAQQWLEQIQDALSRLSSTDVQNNIEIYRQTDDLLYTAIAMFPPTDRHLAIAFNALGVCAASLALFLRAEPLYRYAIDIMHETAAPEDPLTARIRLNLAMLYRDYDRFDLADIHFQLAFDVISKEPGLDKDWFDNTAHHFNHMLRRWEATAAASDWMKDAERLVKSKDWEGAEALYTRAYGAAAQAFPVDHPAYCEIFGPLVAVKRALGKEEEALQLDAAVKSINESELQLEQGIKEIERQLPPMPPLTPLKPHHH